MILIYTSRFNQIDFVNLKTYASILPYDPRPRSIYLQILGMRHYQNYREKLVALFPLISDLEETTFHNPLSNLSIVYHSLTRLEILLSLECFAGYEQNYDTQLHRQQQYNTPDSAT